MISLNILFVLLFLALYCLIIYYIGKKFQFTNSRVYWVILFFVGFCFIIDRIFAKYIPLIIEPIIMYIGVYWLGILFYLLLFLIPIEILKLLSKRLNFIPSKFKDHINYKLAGKISVLVIIFLLMVYGTFNARTLRVTNYNLTINKRINGLNALKIALVSDIHIGSIIDKSRVHEMIKKINEQHPDVIVIAGDIVDDDLKPLIRHDVYKEFANLKSKYGTYGVLGNHDYYGANPDKLTAYMKKSNVTILRDKWKLIANSFYIIGRNDKSLKGYNGTIRPSLKSLLRSINTKKLIILVDHQPFELNTAPKLNVDIELSGHTHGGQLFPDRFLTGRMYDNVYGEIKDKNFYSIVSSGFGTWGPPLRIGSKSEVVIVNLKFKQ